jgi:hypothetical protein
VPGVAREAQVGGASELPRADGEARREEADKVLGGGRGEEGGEGADADGSGGRGKEEEEEDEEEDGEGKEGG